MVDFRLTGNFCDDYTKCHLTLYDPLNYLLTQALRYPLSSHLIIGHTVNLNTRGNKFLIDLRISDFDEHFLEVL